jgi:hypothetical protein
MYDLTCSMSVISRRKEGRDPIYQIRYDGYDQEEGGGMRVTYNGRSWYSRAGQ